MIKDLKDLEKLIKLCRKTGIVTFRIDNIEFHLGQEPLPKSTLVTNLAQNVTYTPGGITEDTKIVVDTPLTDEELLFYSAGPDPIDHQQ